MDFHIRNSGEYSLEYPRCVVPSVITSSRHNAPVLIFFSGRRRSLQMAAACDEEVHEHSGAFCLLWLHFLQLFGMSTTCEVTLIFFLQLM